MGELLAGLDFDPYEVLGVAESATPKELKMGFRKKALEFHPDKNPQRKEWAEEMFRKVSKALEVLADDAARAALDRLRQAKAAARARHSAQDAKRRKLREELERREAGGKTQAEMESAAMRDLELQIQRLRREGANLLQREAMEELDKELRAQPAPSTSAAAPPKTAKVVAKWAEAGTYDEAALRTLFEAYGPVSELLVRKRKKKGWNAVVEFRHAAAAKAAVERERGIPGDPLELSWLEGRPEDQTKPKASPAQEERPWPGPMPSSFDLPRQRPSQPTAQAPASAFSAAFEDDVLSKLAAASKAQKLKADPSVS